MGGCGVWLKGGGWGVCSGCYKKGHKGRTEECGEGFALCRGCGVHVKASVGACKPCLIKERMPSVAPPPPPPPPPLPSPSSPPPSSPPPAVPLRVADEGRRDRLCAKLLTEGFLPDDVPWTPGVVRSSYRKFWFKHHPDKGGEPRDDIVDVFKELMALDEAGASAVPTPVRERASPSPSEEWETCMGGCGTLLKAGGWGVCNGCYKSGHKGRTEQCSDGFVLCRGCGVHVKASVGACKPCLKKERQADGNPVDAPAVGFVLCRGGCGAHVKASRGVCKPCAKVESELSPKQ